MPLNFIEHHSVYKLPVAQTYGTQYVQIGKAIQLRQQEFSVTEFSFESEFLNLDFHWTTNPSSKWSFQERGWGVVKQSTEFWLISPH